MINIVSALTSRRDNLIPTPKPGELQTASFLLSIRQINVDKEQINVGLYRGAHFCIHSQNIACFSKSRIRYGGVAIFPGYFEA